MNKYIQPISNIRAVELVDTLRNCIRRLSKLADEVDRTKISLSKSNQPDFKVWLIALSFMTRKTCSLYLGSTDYDYNINDLRISFLGRKENEDVN